MARVIPRWTLLAALGGVALLALPPRPADAQQTDRAVMFFALGDKIPRGLHDFQAFGLIRDAAPNGRPRYSGWVMTDRANPNRSTSDMRTIRDDGRTLSFTARTRQGFLVTFDGRFLHRGDLRPYVNKDVPVVEGVARKFRAGRKVAEGRLRFSCGTGD